MSYISLSEKDKKEMLARIGVNSIAELFCCIPEELASEKPLCIPGPMTEPELFEYFEAVARSNTYQKYLSFLGAGAYPHLVPSVVDYLSSRGEFISPYTPYQPEVSQGTLQLIFEFQTLICQLTGMDVANASLYDGASGAAEAVLMADRLKNRAKVLVAKNLHPQYREVIRTYSENLDFNLDEVTYNQSGEMDLDDLKKKLDDRTSAVVVQSPNFFGIIEKLTEISELAHRHDALCVVVVAEPLSLGILEAPGHLGADIVAGEGQSFGIAPSYGGPYLGFMACRKDFVRQFPGRIAGQTKDIEGKRGYVLTLSTREQFIRRERATSNICTNQAWCALRATIFLEILGKEGLRELAVQNLQKANYLKVNLAGIKGVKTKFAGKNFNEFVLEFDRSWADIHRNLVGKGIIGGLPLEKIYPELTDSVLLCVTELHKKEDMDRMLNALQEACR